MRIILVAALLWCLCARAIAQQPSMSKDELLEILETLQRRTWNLEIEAHATQYSADKATGLLKDTPYFTHTRLVVDGEPGARVRLDSRLVLPWFADGEWQDKPGDAIEQYAFNGKVGSHVERRSDNNEPLQQILTPERPSRDVRQLGRWTGEDMFITYYEDAGLAQLLRKKGEKWEFRDAGDGTVVIRFPKEFDAEDRSTQELTVDLARGGAITAMRLMAASGEVAAECKNIVLKQNADGVWLPGSAEDHDYEGGIVWKITFVSASVNKVIPDGVFLLDFDPGQVVTDVGTGASFVAGHVDDASLLKDIDKALADVRPPQAEPLESPGDARRAAARNGGVPVEPSYGPRTARNPVALAVAVLALAGAIVLLRRAFHRATPIVLLCAVSCCACCAFAAEAPAANQDYWWEGYGVRVPVFQCGVYSIAVQLSNAGQDADISAIRAYLPSARAGVPLLQVKEVLEAYGFDVNGVKSLTTGRLMDHLRHWGSAIVVLSSGEEGNHFISVIGNRGDDYLVVDCPEGGRAVPKETMRALLESSGGEALLLSRSRAPIDVENLSVQVTPKSVDLGDLRKKREKTETEFTLANLGKRTLKIKSTRAPCGCVKMQPSSSWIAAGARVTVKCVVTPEAWGHGETKHLYVHFADGSYAVCDLKGKVDPEPQQREVVALPGVIWEDDRSFGSLNELTRTVLLRHVQQKPLKFMSSSCDQTWLDAKVSSGEQASEARVALRIQKAAQHGIAEGTARILFDGIAEPGLIVVRQEVKPLFECEPSLLVFGHNVPKTRVVGIYPRNPDQTYVIESVENFEPYLSATWQNGPLKGPANVTIALQEAGEPESEKTVSRIVRIRVLQDARCVSLPIVVVLLQQQGKPEKKTGQRS